MEPVANDGGVEEQGISLSDLWAILQLQRRVIVGSVLVCLAIAVLYSALATRQYKAVSVIQVAPVAAKEINTDGVVTDLTASWNRNIDMATKLAIVESPSLSEKVLVRFEELAAGQEGYRPETPGEIRRSLSAQQRKGTELIDISLTTPDPEVSAMLANLVAEVFQNESLAANTDAAKTARTWLKEQITEYEGRIEEYAKELNDFERQHDLAGSSDDSDAESSMESRMDSLNEAYGELNTEVVLQRTLVSNYSALLKQGRYEDLAKEMATPLIQSLISRYAVALAEHARVSAIYGEKMPERRAADAELRAIEAELKSEVEKTLSAERAKLTLLVNKRNSLDNAIGDGKDQILGLQEIWGEYERKRADLTTAKAFYQRLRSRSGELELQAQTQFNRIRILERAKAPRRPTYPIISINLLLGLLSGIVLGFGIAFAREWFDDSISSPVEVATYLRVPFLGAVPVVDDEDHEGDRALYSHVHPRSVLAEAARGVRTVLDLNPVSVPKRILVTSAISSEGKTSTAVRLAIAYASANRTVVVVDCDLRRPRIHKVFGVERSPGLTSLILGGNMDEVLISSQVPNLFFLPSGHAGERPDELLTAAGFQRVLDDLSRRFDLVIIDSPPSVIVSDARLLSRHVDGVVLVVREQVTARSVVREALTGLQQVGAHIYGVVINAVDFNQRRTSYKYYGYGYGYGYRYRYDEEPEKPAAK
ncbi:MAG: polysaccharide biosynthesis tyrosine autokinase [Myxococcales bacterium]|nr:polysaccharide biosynthesis tyrosine autokinase [Myxococcales bacterium]